MGYQRGGTGAGAGDAVKQKGMQAEVPGRRVGGMGELEVVGMVVGRVFEWVDLVADTLVQHLVDMLVVWLVVQ